jgi:hypothetical protein
MKANPLYSLLYYPNKQIASKIRMASLTKCIEDFGQMIPGFYPSGMALNIIKNHTKNRSNKKVESESPKITSA